MLRALIIAIAVMTFGVASAEFVSAHPSWGIVVDRNNQIYFSDLETVWKIDTQGKLTIFRAGVSGRHTHDLNLDEDGNLYGVDNGYEPATQRFSAALWKMTPAGEFSYVVAPTYDPPKGLTIWKDRAGNSFYISQSENAQHDIFVLKRTPQGNVTTIAGNRPAGDAYRQVALYSAGGTALDSDGTLYFTDNANVRRVTTDGQMTMLASNLALENPAESAMPESRVTRLFGIAVDGQGNAFVADYGNRRVLKITSGGVVSTVTTAEKPWTPTGVTLKDGNLYLLEFGFTPPSKYTARVRRLAPDGEIVVLATAGDAEKSAAQKSADDVVETKAVPARRGPYALIGAVLGIVGLGVIGWFAAKRMLAHQRQGNQP
jgi:sugar lactone lactonase YvrE